MNQRGHCWPRQVPQRVGGGIPGHDGRHAGSHVHRYLDTVATVGFATSLILPQRRKPQVICSSRTIRYTVSTAWA
jgi:hypothetical protein